MTPGHGGNELRACSAATPPFRQYCETMRSGEPATRAPNTSAAQADPRGSSTDAPYSPGSSAGLTALSVYSGAGGLDLGFRRAGFDIVWAVDSDRDAVSTYRHNVGDHVVHGELPLIRPPARLQPDIVIGGPPCQGFSVIGRMDPKDPRSRHVHGFLDVVRRYRPAAFCMENVRALADATRWQPVRYGLRRRAEELGYNVELLVLHAGNFGVPQARVRMFLIGVRDGQPLCPIPPRGRRRTVRDALAGLPAHGEPGNDTFCRAKVVPAKRPVMRPSPYRGSLLFNGSGRPLQLDAAVRTLPASMGGNATPIIDQRELATGAAPWVVGYHRRLTAGEPPLKRAPSFLRRITVEEAAALQAFPAGWDWQGSLASRFRQIGNAVPPPLAYYVARSLRVALENRLLGSGDGGLYVERPAAA